jgi:hypothetical protein
MATDTISETHLPLVPLAKPCGDNRELRDALLAAMEDVLDCGLLVVCDRPYEAEDNIHSHAELAAFLAERTA